MTTLARGTVKRIHVDRQVIASNRKHLRDDPALTIQTSKGSIKARDVWVNGPSRMVQSTKPLSCGARVWLETRSELYYSE